MSWLSEIPEGIDSFGYADDLNILVEAKTEGTLRILRTLFWKLHDLVLEETGLKLPDKSE